jgi:hypothetical protein
MFEAQHLWVNLISGMSFAENAVNVGILRRGSGSATINIREASMLFKQAFASAAGRVSITATVLAVAASLASATAARAESEIAIVITKVTALDAADVWLAGPDDFYARVTIDGEVFTTKIKRQQNHAEPNWKITKVVRGRSHDVKLEIYDKDIGKGDDKIDINRVGEKRDLDFVVDTRRCRIEGFSERYRCGEPIRREGYEQKKASIEFYVDVVR